jgi:hypothetical protein
VAGYFVVILVVLTSLGMYWFGAKIFGFSPQGLRPAFGKVLESIGLTLLFFALDLAVGMFTILAGRFLTGGFVSLYLASDATLLVLALLQGLTFQWWRELSRHRRLT